MAAVNGNGNGGNGSKRFESGMAIAGLLLAAWTNIPLYTANQAITRMELAIEKQGTLTREADSEQDARTRLLEAQVSALTARVEMYERESTRHRDEARDGFKR